jgi:hypothetical protein
MDVEAEAQLDTVRKVSRFCDGDPIVIVACILFWNKEMTMT